LNRNAIVILLAPASTALVPPNVTRLDAAVGLIDPP
jgi:hypothetical protein